MKAQFLFTLVALFTLSAFSQSDTKNQVITTEFTVLGNCGMCKTRIEKAAKIKGVKSADWNVDTKILKLEYSSSKTTLEAIHKNIAKAGHDTEEQRTSDAVYNRLHHCCKYPRTINHPEKQ